VDCRKKKGVSVVHEGNNGKKGEIEKEGAISCQGGIYQEIKSSSEDALDGGGVVGEGEKQLRS